MSNSIFNRSHFKIWLNNGCSLNIDKGITFKISKVVSILVILKSNHDNFVIKV